MAKILLQTTIPQSEDNWHVGRFGLLTDELRRAGHETVARNREEDADGNDPVLRALADSDFDQLWLMAVDAGGKGEGLSAEDARAILEFRARGGGVLTARDHQDLGSCITCLGTIGIVNHFHTVNPERDAACLVNDDQDNPNISYPNYHSGANGDYQRVEPSGEAHEVLRSDRAPDGVIAFFPAHPHEGAVGVTDTLPFARVIARGKSKVSGRPFNIAVAVENEPHDGGTYGRAIAESTFHHFADVNWDIDRGAPSFVTDKPGHEMKDDPSRLDTFKDYVRNIARWLGSRSTA